MNELDIGLISVTFCGVFAVEADCSPSVPIVESSYVVSVIVVSVDFFTVALVGVSDCAEVRFDAADELCTTADVFVKAAVKGTLYAEAKEQSLNAKLATYTVLVTDDNKNTVAIFQGMVYRKQDVVPPTSGT